MTAHPIDPQPTLFLTPPPRTKPKRPPVRGQYDKVRAYFEDHPNEIVTFRALENATQLTHIQALAGITYWHRDYADEAPPVVLQRGKKWKYVPPTETAPAVMTEEALRAAVEKVMADFSTPPPPPAPPVLSKYEQEAHAWMLEGAAMARRSAGEEILDMMEAFEPTHGFDIEPGNVAAFIRDHIIADTS